MAHHIGPDAAIIEFGMSTKTRDLLNQLEKPAAYVPVDIAAIICSQPPARLRDYLHAAYPDLRRLHPAVRPAGTVYAAHRRVVYFPGSTLGNFDLQQAHTLLQRMRQIIGNEGAVLIGIDLEGSARAGARTTIAPA